jgi:hypothetical protein
VKSKIFAIFLVVLALALAGCWKSPQQKAKEAEKKMEEARKQMEEAQGKMQENYPQGMDKMKQAMEKMGEAMAGGKVDPVDFRELKALLPEEAGELKRTEATGEKTAQMGIKVSKAEATYERGEEPGRINISILDMGTMKGFAAMGSYGWALADVDKESDSGYEKTTMYSGCKAFEKYDNDSRSGEIQVLVADRFMVEVHGSDVSMSELKATLNSVDLGKLKRMKDVGVQSE